MSAADLSLVGAAAYTARTKRARLRVHGGEEEEERQIYRSDAARKRNDPMNRRRPSRVYFFYSGGILEGEGEQQLPRHTPGKMPRFEQIDNLYRCRDAEMAKEGDDGGSGSLRILARPFLASIF